MGPILRQYISAFSNRESNNLSHQTNNTDGEDGLTFHIFGTRISSNERPGTTMPDTSPPTHAAAATATAKKVAEEAAAQQPTSGFKKKIKSGYRGFGVSYANLEQ